MIQLIYFQETSAQLFAALELTFSIDLSPEEGGGVPNTSVELVSRGRDLEVNSHNVYTYVRKYSQYRYKMTINFILRNNCIIAFPWQYHARLDVE